MPQVTKEVLGTNHYKVTFVIEKADYEKDVKDSLKKLQRDANIKGFRKGAAPESLIKAKYGKDVMEEKIFEIVRNSWKEHFEAENQIIVESPIPSGEINLSLTNMVDQTFAYEYLSLPKDYPLVACSPETSLPFYNLEVSEGDIDAEIAQARKFAGKREEADAIPDSKDFTLKGEDLNEAGEVVNDKAGLYGSYTSDAFLKRIAGSKIGDTIEFSLEDIVSETNAEQALRIMLGRNDGAELPATFKFRITTITVMTPATELSSEDIRNAFYIEAANEEEAKKELTTRAIENNRRQSLAAFADHAFINLYNANNFDFPEDFFQRMVESKGYKIVNFAKWERAMKWRLMIDVVEARFKIEIQREDIEGAYYSNWYKYSRKAPDVKAIWQNEELLQELIQDSRWNKCRVAVADSLTKLEETVTKEVFDEKVKEINALWSVELESGQEEGDGTYETENITAES